MAQKYKVTEDQLSGLKAGTIVEMFYGPTYGLDAQDSLATGEYYVPVIEEDGVGPFFTCKHEDLEELD